jgi:hypothetical protein
MIPDERRRFPRFPFHSRGFLSIGERQHLGSILDVSLKGALFSSVEPLELTPGTACRLEIYHAGQEEVGAATAVVVYCREGLIGLELHDVDAATGGVLARVVAMNLGVSSLLERNLPDMLGAGETIA